MPIKVSPRSFGHLLDYVNKRADFISPRGINTREMVNAHLVVTNPVDRLVISPERKLNSAFGIAEWASVIYGIEDISFFTRFIPSYTRFSSDGSHLDGAYGKRNFWNGKSQIEALIEKLKTDPNSRQAVLSIYQADDSFGAGGLNTPCTLSLQFLIRDEKLHCITTMRSNDLWLGFPYDLFNFSMIQEYIARKLSIPLGKYYHNAGSLHIYENDMPKVMAVVLEDYRYQKVMNPMPNFTPKDEDFFKGMIRDFDFFSKASSFDWSSVKTYSYFTSLAATLFAFEYRKSNEEAAKYARNLIFDKTLKFVLKGWDNV